MMRTCIEHETQFKGYWKESVKSKFIDYISCYRLENIEKIYAKNM